MGHTMKVALGLLLLSIMGCDYLPQSANWPINAEQTQAWIDKSNTLTKGVTDAYQTHQVVAVGDYHWNNQVMAQVNNLIKQPAFLDQVKQIVVEFGNSRYQQAMDDFLNGKSHDVKILDDVRRDALFFTAWMPEDYKNFFLHVRAYNLNVSDSDKVKVWLAESPFYWEKVKTRDEWQQAANHKTDGFLSTVQKAIESGNKVFMVFGAFHLLNIQPASDDVELPLASRLKRIYPNKVFTIWPITEPEINQALSKLPVPSLLSTKVTQASKVKLIDILPKARTRLGRINQRDASVQQLVDGLLYVGESENLTQFPKSMMQDQAWLQEMEARLNIVGGRAQSVFKEILDNSQ